jgi:hypothetical protein
MRQDVTNTKLLVKNMFIKAMYRTNTKAIDFARTCDTHRTDINKMQSEDCLSNNVKFYQLVMDPNLFKHMVDQVLNHFGDYMAMSNINGTLTDECMELMVVQGEFIKEFESGMVSQKTIDEFEKVSARFVLEAKAQRGK